MIIGEGKNTKMTPAICTQCGGQFEVDAQRESAFCQYCGTKFNVEKAINTYNIQHATVQHVDTITINKTGAVESVLNFVKDQQRQKQEEKRRKEEEAKRIEEENNKQLKKYWWIYLLMLAILFLWLSFNSSSDSSIEEQNKISVNYSASQLEGINYQDVVTRLQNNGFTSIRTEVKKDLVMGLFTNDGEVERVEINGDFEFESGNHFPKDAEIIVIYHTFP